MKRILVLIFYVFCCIFAFSGEKVSEMTEHANVLILNEYHEMTSDLIHNFGKSNDLEYKKSVIYTLGELRAKEAIPFLLENILFGITKDKVTLKMPKYGKYPAAWALSKVGIPAIMPVIEKIKLTNDPYIREILLLHTLYEIDKASFVLLRLKNEFKKTEKEQEKANLSVCIKWIEEESIQYKKENSDQSLFSPSISK